LLDQTWRLSYSRISAGVLLTSIYRHIVVAWLTITAKCCIEKAFSKIKVALRKAQARTREALIEALGVAISTVTAKDARGYFEHGGYHLPVHFYETRCR
jgi:hypothetical protein